MFFPPGSIPSEIRQRRSIWRETAFINRILEIVLMPTLSLQGCGVDGASGGGKEFAGGKTNGKPSERQFEQENLDRKR